MVERFIELTPAFLIDAVDKQIGIIGRLRNERQNVAGGGFNRDQGSPEILERLLGDTLQAHVERQHQVGAGHRIDTAQYPHRPAPCRDLDLLHAGLAVQRRFPRFLEALLSDRVGAAVVACLATFFQGRDIGFGDAPDIADDVCRRLALGVFAHPPRAKFHARELKRVRRKPCRLGFIEIVAQDDVGVLARLGDAPLEPALVGCTDMHDGRELAQEVVDIARPARHHFNRVAQEVAGEHLAIAVDDLAATRRNRHHGDAVAVSACRKAFVPVDLQHPESCNQHAKTSEREHACDDGPQEESVALLLPGFLELEHVAANSDRSPVDIVHPVLGKQQDPADGRPERRCQHDADHPGPPGPESRLPGTGQHINQPAEQKHR